MKKNNEGSYKLVIVESPTKAKTIKKFLDKTYLVESCMGHIRDLPQSAKDIPERFKKESWASLSVNVDKNFEPIYCVPKNKTKIVKHLKEKMSDASELILATDEDREGESISWHLVEILKPKVNVKRMIFHEITEEAIKESLNNFRQIDFNLVKAQEARRILDRLVGYTISPLLWKKIAYGLSAGRVQSVAVKLVSEREEDRHYYLCSKYWHLNADLNKKNISFKAKIVNYKDKKIATNKDYDAKTGHLLNQKNLLVLDEKSANNILSNIKDKPWIVNEVNHKPFKKRPFPPFITSTLQQEANRKLKISAKQTMQIAQKLYEQGYITYMRTDSTFLSDQAIHAARKCINKKFGSEYLPPGPRSYAHKKSKGAQEAHEAIRPSGKEFIDPNHISLSGLELALYDLIWKRTIASQMKDADQKQVTVKFGVEDAIFHSSGIVTEFPGFLKAYIESIDEDIIDNDSGTEVILPELKVKEEVNCKKINLSEHETRPPNRFTEASLIQKMEKEGIGRPSTYAVIISTIIDRGYVQKSGSTLIPTFTAIIVSKLLNKYLPKYVDLDFTAKMEETLDNIAVGELNHVEYLGSFYLGKDGLKNEILKKEKDIDPKEAKSIVFKDMPNFIFKTGRYGSYLCMNKQGKEVCASIPVNQYPADINPERAKEIIEDKLSGNDALGVHPDTKQPIYVLTGKYSPYVQLGNYEDEGNKIKRMAIPDNINHQEISLEEALFLLSLPKTLGIHPDLNKEIKLGQGRFGPYVVCDGDYRSIPKGESLFTMNFDRALELLLQPKRVGKGKKIKPFALKAIGEHPDLKKEINLMEGPYGKYLNCGNINVSLAKDIKADDLSLDSSIKLLNEKIIEKGKGKGKSKGKGKGKGKGKDKNSKSAKSSSDNINHVNDIKEEEEERTSKSKGSDINKMKKKQNNVKSGSKVILRRKTS